MARKNYTDEQKAEILKKAEETSVSEASKEYGVARKTISEWKSSAENTKKTHTGRKVKDAVTAVAEKVDNKKLADQMAVGRVKAKRERKATDKATAKADKAAVKAADKEERQLRSQPQKGWPGKRTSCSKVYPAVLLQPSRLR